MSNISINEPSLPITHCLQVEAVVTFSREIGLVIHLRSVAENDASPVKKPNAVFERSSSHLFSPSYLFPPLLPLLKRSYYRYVVIHCTSGKPDFTPHI